MIPFPLISPSPTKNSPFLSIPSPSFPILLSCCRTLLLCFPPPLPIAFPPSLPLVSQAYPSAPPKTIPAPTLPSQLSGLPNTQTLNRRLVNFLTLSTTATVTADEAADSWFTPRMQRHWVTPLAARRKRCRGTRG